jgi:glutathione S-transferase
MSARFELYGIYLSGPAYKVALMLSLAHEPFDYVHLNLRGGEHKTDAFRSKSKFGQVPLLIDHSNGQHVVQSMVILDYLADKLGKFGGSTLNERIEARQWMAWGWDRLSINLYRSRAGKLGFRQIDPATQAVYEADGKAALEILEDGLKGRNWLVGDHVTMADLDLYGTVRYAPEGGFDLSVFPNISAWMKRIEALDGFKQPDVLMPVPKA